MDTTTEQDQQQPTVEVIEGTVEPDENEASPDDAVEPADAVVEDAEVEATEEQQAKSQEVAKRVATMDLSLHGDMDPNDLSPAQISALRAIVNFELNDPGAWPNTIAFMHMCVKRGLDPFAREAYLIARGKIDSNPKFNTRKYTMQTGIDGYRILASRTGKFVGVKDRVWTGKDDDQTSWRWDERAGIMRRVWFDQWPASKGQPGAARVTVMHYDDRGGITETQYVADWDMYCPMYDEWSGNKKTGRKTPGDMWVKGGPMMLSKCLPGRALIPTDRGMLPIRDIVEQRLPVKVRSMDLDTGREVWQPVVNYWRNAPTNEWVRLWSPNGTRGNHAQRITHDHPVWTPTGYVKAGELVLGDLVATASPVLSREQEQVILGGLLGDAHLAGRKRASTQPHFAVTHSIGQAEYARWTADALASIGTTVTEGTNGDGTGKRHPVINVRTRAAASLYGYRSMTPQQWLAGLDDLGLAVWLMDDGAFKATGGKSGSFAVNIHCCGFGVEFADAAVAWLADRYGVTSARVHRRDHNPYISIGSVESAALVERLAPYIRRGADGRKMWTANKIEQGHDGYAFVPVTKVEHVVRAKRETRYDIEVEGTHSFVTGTGLVVSNCAEAAALRMALPGGLNGLYIHEEMHRADQIEADRAKVEAEQRLIAHHAAKATKTVPASEANLGGQAEQQALHDRREPVSAEMPGAEPAGPPAGVPSAPQEPAPETQEPAESDAAPAEQDEGPTPEQALTWLRAEVGYQSAVLDKPVADIVRRQMDAAGVEAMGDLTAEDLSEVVIPNRRAVIARLRRDDRVAEADAYAKWGPQEIGPIEVLTGRTA